MASTSTQNTSESLLGSAESKVLVLPGDCILAHDKNIIASTGTYLKNGYIYASLAGQLEIELIKEESEKPVEAASGNMNTSLNESQSTISKRVVRVVRPGSKKVPFPEPGSIVTARVLYIKSNLVKCSIHCVEDHTLKVPYGGVIRTEDIRDYDKDKIVISRCFSPGDIILARVYAHGEKHEFLLTTAAPELGVVIATNDWGEPMVPIGLNEMLSTR
ncbi:PREDICTED: exosome complex component CSL4-like, partial [Rhagoletis zephyria]|uniref:exosome complex component CSL4-like n=1 Tax=Rhagoletis zephyria TaxID=28612 RepID=UPI00081146B7